MRVPVINNHQNNKTDFQARVFWHSKNSSNFKKDFPDLVNILKHHFGGDDVIHYVQYDKFKTCDAFSVTSIREGQSSVSYQTADVAVKHSESDIRRLFQKHYSKRSKLRDLDIREKPAVDESADVKPVKKGFFKRILGRIFGN